MRTQSKNRLFGILIALVLVACVFLTLTPIALADEPAPEAISEEMPLPVLYDDEAEPEAISEEVPKPVLYDEQAEPEAISDEAAEPVLYDEQAEVEAISIDEPQPELISEQPTAKAMPTWGWVMIMVGIAALSALITFVIVTRKRKKATS